MPSPFLPEGAYESPSREYFLLPFRFHVLDENREILVNEVGDYILCPRGTAQRLATRELVREDELFPDLLARFFVSDTPVPALLDIMAVRYRTKKDFLASFTALHIIVVTLRCNFSCHYCQVSRKTANRAEFDISTAHIDRSLDLIFASPSPALTIEFQGGEPLAAFERVRYAVEGAQARNAIAQRNLRFVLCTNLSLLTEESLAFCREHDILISTSLDGPLALHEANRPSNDLAEHPTLRDQVSRARAALGEDRVAALMTTSRASLSNPEGIIDAYRSMGFNRIFLRPIHPYGFASRLSERLLYSSHDFLEFYRRALLYIISLNKQGESFAEDYASIILKKMLTPFSTGYVDLQSPTGLVSAVAVYNYDGGVYASDESRMLAETGDQTFRLGSVHDSYEQLFYGERARSFAEHGVTESLAGCSECGLQAYCGSDVVRNHAQTGDLEGFRPQSSFCTTNMGIIEFLIDLLETDEASAKVLRSWAA